MGARWGESLALVLLFALIFFCLQRFTFLLRFPPHERTTLWAPGALTFTALLLSPYQLEWEHYPMHLHADGGVAGILTFQAI